MRRLLLACALLIAASASAAIPTSEREALAAIYQSTNGAQWLNHNKWLGNESECTWYGVQCNEAETNVIGLYLYDNGLDGTLPSSIRNLTKLEQLQIWSNNLRGALPNEIAELTNLDTFFADRNHFTGTIPPQFGALKKLTRIGIAGNALTGPLPAEFGDMIALEEVYLSVNQIDGKIPDLSKLTNLQVLELHENRLSGAIPASLGSLPKLEQLLLLENQLTGTIPEQLGNLASLITMNLSYNQLTGPIPATFGQLRKLDRLELGNNGLTGPIPVALGDLSSSLQFLNLTTNHFNDKLPDALFRLTKLEELQLGDNDLTGTIPAQIGNLVNLQVLALYANELTGPIPAALTSIAPLRSVELGANDLEGPLPTDIGRLTNLTTLDVSQNGLNGSLPPQLGDLSKLDNLMLYENDFVGTIPPELGRLSELRILSVAANHLTGTIPDALRSLTKLQQFYANGNELTGQIPSWIGEWKLLLTFFVSFNKMSGPLPDGLATLDNMTQLDLAVNQFSGRLIDFTRLTNLTYLTLAFNDFTGPLPPSIGVLSKLDYAAWGNNHFSGPIPHEIGGLTSVTYLDLTENDFDGPIPAEIGQLKKAYAIALHNNHLSGTLPKELGELTALQFLSVSFNALKGPIPSEITHMTGLEDHRSDFAYNGLYATDATTRDFVNLKHYDGDFEQTQTVMPTNIRLVDTTDRSATLSWDPIRYSYYGGGYQVIASTTLNGPPAVVATTSSKSLESITVRNLNPSTTYYFTVATVSHPISDQENLIVSDRSAPIQGTTKQRVIAPPDVVVTDAPSGMVQIDGVEVDADSFTVTNFGDVATTIALEKSENFFTVSPTQFQLAAGGSQKITLHSTPQPVSSYYGYVAINGVGAAEDLLVEVVLLSSARPAGRVVATPVATRIELAGVPGSDQVGTAQFRNTGTARLTGIIVSDQPWVVATKEPLTIDPGNVGSANFSIIRSRRPEGTEGGLIANLTLVYVSGSESLKYGDIEALDASNVSVSKVTIVDVTKPPVSTGPIPTLGTNELAFFIPGIASATSSHADVSILNAAGATAINDLKLYFTNGPQTSIAAMQPLGFAKAVSLPNIVNSIYGNASASGTLQIRSLQSGSLTSEGKVTAVTSGGTYTGSIPVFRGDRSIATGASLYLTGLSNPGDLLVQETSGGNANVHIELRDASGGLVSAIDRSVAGYSLLELTNTIPANVTTAVIRNLGSGLVTSYARLRDANGDTWSVADWSRFYGYTLADAVRIPFANGGQPQGGGGNKRRAVRNDAIATNATTDVVLYNPGITEAKATIAIEGGSNRTVTVAAGATVTVANAGSPSLASTVSLLVTPTKGTLAVTARSHHATGGSAIPVLPATSGLRLGQTQIFSGLDDSAAVRTSFGLTESSGATVKVRVKIIIDESSPLTATITSKTFTLAANTQTFLPELVRSFAGDQRDTLFGDLHNLTLEFDVIEGDGSVVPFIIATDVASGDSNVTVQ